MKGIRFFLLTSVLCLAQPAMSAQPLFGTDAETRYTRELTPQAGKALVYIYQRPQDGESVSPTIWLNNSEIGRLVPGSFTVWQFSPGQVNIRVEGVEPARHTIAVQAGSIYLFRLSVMQTEAGAQPNLQAMPASYRGDLATTRLIKNPRELTVPARTVVTPTPAPATAQAKPAESAVQQKPVAEEQPTQTADKPKPDPSKGNYALFLKAGSLGLAEDRQTILGNVQAFDDSASGVFAVELAYRLGRGLSVGGELVSYSADFTTLSTSAQNETSVLAILANVRQYFRTDASLQPFIGAGIGAAVTDTSGAIVGSTSGLAYQLVGGVEYRSTGFGVFAEYKYLSADTESSNNEKIDVSASGVFAGIAFYF